MNNKNNNNNIVLHSEYDSHCFTFNSLSEIGYHLNLNTFIIDRHYFNFLASPSGQKFELVNQTAIRWFFISIWI